MLMFSTRTLGLFRRLLLFGIMSCALLSIMFVVSRTIEKENFKEEHRQAMARIVCLEEDYLDTPFITQLKKSDVITLPGKDRLRTLSREELSFLYHRYVESLQYFCSKISRVGSIADGGWDVCDERKFLPKTPCIVYSFGINYDFSFDDSTIERYGCEVHSFDPSMDIDSFRRHEFNYFHKLGIASNDTISKQGWELMRLESIKAQLGHKGVGISILKMDVETMEWDVLNQMISNNNLRDIDHLLVEFHMNVKWPPTEEGRNIYLRNMLLLKDIYDAGFRIFWTHRNIAGSLVFKSKCKREERANCHEVSFVRLPEKELRYNSR